MSEQNYQEPKKGRPLLGCLIGLLIGFAPAIPLIVLSLLSPLVPEWQNLNEGNSSIGAMPWFLIYTFPIGGIIGLSLFVRGVRRNRNRNRNS